MRRLFVCLLLAFGLGPAVRAAEPVDLLLVLAADVSRSVDGDKFKLQREGYAAAIADLHVLDAIRSGRNGRIAVLFEEWSGFGSQKIVIDWTLIDGALIVPPPDSVTSAPLASVNAFAVAAPDATSNVRILLIVTDSS